jgi:3-hydroxy acid dehydrogenase / malonic semialdehyde reductase
MPTIRTRASCARPSELTGRPACSNRGGARLLPFVAALAGKTAIVTGASSGMGAAIAAALVREGARAVGGARRTEEIAPDVIAHALDVTDRRSCEEFIEFAVGELGKLDILVNNAGLGLGRDPFDESTEEDEEIVLETNVHGLIRMTRLCLPHLAEYGHIVNIGSIAGRQAYDNAALYVTSKFAVRGFTYALREDLLGRPIKLTTVDPGLVETNFSKVRFRGDEEKASTVYRGVEAMRPEDIAECVVFAVTRPRHVNIDELVVKALAQSSAIRIVRSE